MIRIGIICPSEIAFRRFLPALSNSKDFEYAGVAIANPEEWFGKDLSVTKQNQVANVIQNEEIKAHKFIESFGGKIFKSYSSMLNSPDIDAIYLPLPPSLHYKWAKEAVENGKHAFIEKPATIDINNTLELIKKAEKEKLALHENYMFVFHNQIEAINDIIKSGKIGDIRLYRIAFGFPRRDINDFRYNKNLGGGALFDCGGYTLKLADMLLGYNSQIKTSHLNYIKDFKVDIYGNATLQNDNGVTAQVSFGMDCGYKCELEIWGSTGNLITNRILTAPAGYKPKCLITTNEGTEEIELPTDDTFMKSIRRFKECIESKNHRIDNYRIIERQAKLVNEFINHLNQ